MKTTKLFLFYTLVSLCVSGFSQKKQYKINTIAFYNLENLFDTKNDPNKLDEKSPIMEMNEKDRPAVYAKKLHNMARVISEIGVDKNSGNINSPAVIGVCEIENKNVLFDLINEPALKDKNYDIIHFDSPDARGIDVALLYQKKLFKPIDYSSHELLLYDDNTKKRIFTRDQLLVSGKLEGEMMHFIVNHWPSRRGGEARSRPKRVAAAQLNKKIIDSLQTIDPNAKIVIMGDMNDDPFNVSVKKVLNAKADKSDVGLKGIYNPMMKMAKKGMGTLAYRDGLNLFDQIMFTKPFLDKDYTSFKIYKTGIYNPSYLTNKKGRYKGYPFRSFVGATFTGGYGDHFPVYTYLIKEVK